MPVYTGLPFSVRRPLTFMDSNLPASQLEARFGRIHAHLSRVGGLITLLWHPGLFNNPEAHPLKGVYNQILRRCYMAGSESCTLDRVRAAA